MKKELEALLRSNHDWADGICRDDPEFFRHLSQQQSPKYLWIGCSDSRVPSNQILGLEPGQVFVHRNIANVMVHSDLNCMSTIQFAVDVLEVRHILVTGHYGCGGVNAALGGMRLGLSDNWICHVRDVAQKHSTLLAGLSEDQRLDALCELNAIEQARNVCLSTVISDAWARGQRLAVHGWVYSLTDGKIRELGMDVHGPKELDPAYARAVEGVRTRRMPVDGSVARAP